MQVTERGFGGTWAQSKRPHLLVLRGSVASTKSAEVTASSLAQLAAKPVAFREFCAIA